MMRAAFLALVSLTWSVAACGTDGAPDPYATRTFELGPYPLAPGQEVTTQCVSVTLHNDEPLYINQVELTTGPGFHHSNWFWVPENLFAGEDGTWTCADRNYRGEAAGLFGGILFAQSTQSPHEIQKFADGVGIKIPPHSKLIADTHMLNAGDTPLAPTLTLAITPIPEQEVTAKLVGMSLENLTIALPPHKISRFTIECDMGPRHQDLLGRAPDFKIYYMLAHYHSLGAGMTLEGVRDSDGTVDMIHETPARAGDALGATIDPPFDVTGHGKLRFSCTFDNPRDTTVSWGVGDQEMCMFLAFTDSPYVWGGGAIDADAPGPSVEHDGLVEFTHPGCTVVATDGQH